jgi:hypothetical protein
MAGTVAKSFGFLFLVPGIALLLVGLTAAVLGYTTLEGAFDTRDEERAQMGAYTSMTGLAAAGAGTLLATVGAILLAVGHNRARRAATPTPGTPAP